jgi:integrase
MSRGAGEGTIIERKDGRWMGAVTIGVNPKTGKLKRKYIYGKGQKEVNRKMTDLKQRLFNGTYIEPSNITLSEWLNKWVEGRKNSLAYSTYRNYKVMIDNHINPEIGSLKLKNTKTRIIQELLNDKLENGRLDGEGSLSVRMVKYIYATLNTALNQAVKEGLLIANPCKAVEAPKEQGEKNFKTWDKKQVDKFLKAARDYRYYILYYLALNTGMRQGELLGLKWEDIDFKAGLLRVKRQVNRTDKGLVFKKVKTRAGKRVIPLAGEVIKELRKQKVNQDKEKLLLGEAYNDNDLVCSNGLGEPVDHRNLFRQFKRIIKKNKITDIRFHDTRHTFATTYLENGGDITVLQQILGHSSITVTIDTYSHVTEEMLKNAANTIQTMYKTGK